MGAEMDHHPETELNAQFRQQRVTGMPSTVGSSDFGAECQSRRRSLSTLSLSSSVVSSAPSGSGSEAAQSSADERRLSLRDFLLGDREASINWESEDDDSTTLNDEGEDEDQAGQDIDASLTVNNIDSSRTLFRGNLFWHLLLGYYFVYTNISILPLGTRLHVATANVAVVTLGPELLWLMRTAHRARTFGLLHIAVKLYTALNCRKVAAVLGLLSIVSSQVARRAPSRSPASILQSLAGSQVTSSTLRVDSMATFTPITLFASATLITSRILPIILVPISSIAISASFCTACALYPNLYHPTTLLSTSLIALLLGLRVEMVGQYRQTVSYICRSGTPTVHEVSQNTGLNGLSPLAVTTPGNTKAVSLASLSLAFVVHSFAKIISCTFFALSATSWLLLMGDLDPERVLIWILGRLHARRYR